LERKEILTHATAWVDLDDVTLSAINQSYREKEPYDRKYIRYPE
jgi:hypothetical protein